MTIKKAIAVVLLLGLTNSIFCQKKVTGSEDFFKKLFNKKFDLFLKKDSAGLAAILHDSLLYIHSSGGMDTKADLINGLFTTSNPYKSFNIYGERVRHINNQTVIVHGMVEISYADETRNSKLLVTEVYTKQKKKWLLISRHANKYSR